MGKKGERLLRLLRPKRGKTYSEEVKKNFPVVQDNQVAQPNDYYKSSNNDDSKVGTDARPHKIQIDDDTMDQTQPMPEKEAVHNNGVVTPALNATPEKIRPLSSLPANRGRARFTSGQNDQDLSEHPQYNEPTSRLSTDFRSKRHTPPKFSDESQDVRSDAKADSCKKEFPSKKPRPAQQCDKTALADPAMISSSPTSFIRDRFGDLIYEQQWASSSQCTNRSPDHAFVTNDNHFTSDEHGTSHTNKLSLLQLHRHCQSQSRPTYINDTHRVDAGYRESGQKLAFTVTDKEGKGIELTIAVYGASPLLTAVVQRKDDCGPVSTPSCNSADGNRYQNFESFSDHSHDYFVTINRDPANTGPTRATGIREDSSLEKTPERQRSTPVVESEIAGDSEYSHVSSDEIALPKESYKLTEDSIRKLKSFCGRNGDQTLVDTVYSSPDNVRLVNDLARVLERVEECPWYWGEVGRQESSRVLSGTSPGTFLLRLSSDPKYLFSISVKTIVGPMSIRIVYEKGYFRFDSEFTRAQRQARHSAPNGRGGHPNYLHKTTKKFPCVIHLILYHTRHLQSSTEDSPSPNADDRADGHFMCYWPSRNGNRKEIPVLLATPLPKKGYFPSLQNLCRAALSREHKLWRSDNEKVLVHTSLRRFIARYPYPV